METLSVRLGGSNFREHLNVVRACKGRRYDPKTKLWLVPASLNNLKILRIIPSMQEDMDKRIDDLEINIEREVLKTVITPEDAYKLKDEYPFMFDYQTIAAHYAIENKKFLIADSVGLGKTIECMPFIDKMVNDGKRIIILCPSSIARQWESEINRFIHLPSVNIVGLLKHKRISEYNNGNKIFITTYESFRNDIVELKKTNYDFSNICVIADEASKFKNKETRIYKELRSIAPELYGFIALSATPIENKLENFFNIVSIIDPGFMSRSEFERNYCVIKGTGKFQKCVGYRNLREFIHKITHIMIRRTKNDVTNLPELTVQNRIIPLTKEQKIVATAVRKYYSETNNLGCIVLLREVANDTSLLNHITSTIVSDMIRHDYLPYDLPSNSNKIPECVDIMEEIGDNKVLIFTQFSRMAHKLGERLDREGHKVKILTGDNSHAERDAVVNELRNGEISVLIATDIFGYGINLQFVDYCINFDIPWNPAKLNQRIGRIHRQGSNNPKTVINLLSEDIDERVYKVLEEKQNLLIRL